MRRRFDSSRQTAETEQLAATIQHLWLLSTESLDRLPAISVVSTRRAQDHPDCWESVGRCDLTAPSRTRRPTRPDYWSQNIPPRAPAGNRLLICSWEPVAVSGRSVRPPHVGCRRGSGDRQRALRRWYFNDEICHQRALDNVLRNAGKLQFNLWRVFTLSTSGGAGLNRFHWEKRFPTNYFPS